LFPLEFAVKTADTPGMEIRGHVRNGVIVLDGNPNLPEGAAVTVSYPALPAASPAPERKRVPFPLVRSTQPGSVHLTNERLAEILDDQPNERSPMIQPGEIYLADFEQAGKHPVTLSRGKN
jgi:hypothetical protein